MSNTTINDFESIVFRAKSSLPDVRSDAATHPEIAQHRDIIDKLFSDEYYRVVISVVNNKHVRPSIANIKDALSNTDPRVVMATLNHPLVMKASDPVKHQSLSIRTKRRIEEMGYKAHPYIQSVLSFINNEDNVYKDYESVGKYRISDQFFMPELIHDEFGNKRDESTLIDEVVIQID